MRQQPHPAQHFRRQLVQQRRQERSTTSRPGWRRATSTWPTYLTPPFGEIQQVENLGLWPMDDGGPWSASGVSALGQERPVNPSGGLASRGHPVSATGLVQVFELVTQFRGRAGDRQVPGTRIAIAENGGGLYGIEEAVAAVTIRRRPS
ncbi:hypothetical protein AADR41_01740 [Streptomyces sp. CLV115]|uniref:thiolase C-terminal domain-containing protein n=1 Tax=Streptomyces sp. CLV115 TaxID=3138502 RepID=UPI00313E9AB7